MSALQKTIQFLDPFLSKWDFQSKPLVLSVSGPQGSGKSYLSSELIEYFQETYLDKKSLVVSTDDLYLTNSEQRKLSGLGNPLLTGRGLPGTHDLELGYDVLSKVVRRERGFSVPTYNKESFNGEGDRGGWVFVDQQIDILIIEGWFNGFLPVEDDVIDTKYVESELLQYYKLEDIKQVNQNLKEYTKIWELVDLNVFYDTVDINNVYDWRTQQEHDLISKKGTGMTDDQVRQFIQRYMVIYDLYYRSFTEKGWSNIRKGHNLRLKLEKSREVPTVEIF